MKNALKYLFFVLPFCICSLTSTGQAGKIDSLILLVKADKPDTNKVKHLCSLSREFTFKNIDSSIAINKQAIEILKTLSTQLREKQLKPFFASTYGDLGIYYMFKGEYPLALEYLLSALELDEQLDNKIGKAKRTGNIGILFEKQLDYNKALEYYFRALEMAKEIKDLKGIAADLNNIGCVYKKQNNYSKALEYLLNSLDIYLKLNSKNEIAMCYANIGGIYLAQYNYQEGLNYLFRYLKIAEEINNKSYQANAIGEIGKAYLDTKDYKKAEPYLKQSVAMNDSIGLIDALKDDEYALSKLYENTGRYKLAFDWFKKAKTHQDSIYNETNKRKLVEQEMTYLFNIKEKEASTLQEKKDVLAAQDKQRQKLIIYFVSGGLFIVLLLAIFIFRGYKQKQKANVIITQQKAEVEKQKELIEEKNRLVEEKHKEITDSINYAKRIQGALLKEEEHVNLSLPQHFIFFMPKDVVSGDFFWNFEKTHTVIENYQPKTTEYWYGCVADCTGHGVPGAMMSMLGMGLLSDVIGGDNLFTPAEILDRLRGRIITELGQTGKDGENKDGMDASLFRLNRQTNELYWAGANNSLYLFRNNELTEVKADKQPVAYHPVMKPFTNNVFQLQQGDIYYLITDGYADQFGGPKGKKFKYKQMEELLISIAQKSSKEQKEILKQTFLNWKGQTEQTDDVTIAGLRV